ncbi:MAG: hypothetical protein NTU84_05550 [Verrucomicrobia bacterium]|nr:hypothetical protein [Verrucomicrobiota bacterium]
MATGRSPLSGCAIFVTAFLVLIFLLVFSVYALFRQYDEIAKFTAPATRPVEEVDVNSHENEVRLLKEKIGDFQRRLGGDEEVSLALTPDEMNLAIASFEAFRDLRGTFRVTAMDGDVMRIAICFQLNGKPRLAREGEGGWMNSDPRYLIGTLVARPALLKHEVVLRIDKIEVEGAVVPPEFIGHMSPYRLAERYLGDAVIGPAMAALTRVEIADGRLVLIKKPGEVPGDEIGRDQVNSSSRRLFTIFGIAATCFLGIAGLVVFMGMRKNPRALRAFCSNL